MNSYEQSYASDNGSEVAIVNEKRARASQNYITNGEWKYFTYKCEKINKMMLYLLKVSTVI